MASGAAHVRPLKGLAEHAWGVARSRAFLHSHTVDETRAANASRGGLQQLCAVLILAVLLLLACALLPSVALADTTETPHGGYSPASKKCDQCHDVHDAGYAKLLAAATPQGVCYLCHDGSKATNVQDDFGETPESAGNVRSRHPVPEGRVKCSDCHTPHKGPAEGNPRSLAAGPADVSSGVEFCGVCHGPGSANPGGDLVSDFAGTAHDVALKPPSGSGVPCASCHEPHGSSNLALIRTEIVDSTGTTRSVEATSSFNPLCLQCHGAPAGAFPGTPVFTLSPHSTVTTSTKASAVYPATKAQAGDCANCHDPHGKGGRPQYLRADGNQLCSDCHDAAGTSRPGTYAYQGSAQYAAGSHSSVTGVRVLPLYTTSSGFAAWESTTLPTPSSPGTTMTAGQIDAMKSQNGAYGRTTLASLTGQSDYQLFRFKLPKGTTGLDSLRASWLGYGSPISGFPVTLRTWDNQAGAWVQWFSGMAATDTKATTATADAGRFVDGDGYVWILGEAKKSVAGDLNGSVSLTAPTTTTVNAQWTTLGASTSWVDYGLPTPPPYMASEGNDLPTTAHSITFTPSGPGEYNYRVRGTDGDGVTVASDNAKFAWPSPFPNPIGGVSAGFGSAQNVTFTWTPGDASLAPFTYRIKITGVNGTSYSYTSPSLTTTSTVVRLALGYYSWTVVGTDTNGVSTPVSMPDTFRVYRTGTTCPYLFTWDGTKWAFESDLFGQGKLAVRTNFGYLKPDPHDYYVLDTTPAAIDGALELRLVEERSETDYLDEFNLYTADVITGRDVVTEMPLSGGPAFEGLDKVVHTVSTEMSAPVSATHVNAMSDIGSLVATSDKTYAVLNADRNTGFTYQTVEFDLGDVASAPQVKLFIDGLTMFPDSPEGIDRARSLGARNRLEVQDASGAWVSVPATVCPMPKPAEFHRPYVMDLTNIWQGPSRRVRLTFLFKTYLDRIAVDTTADEPVALTKLQTLSADLRVHGFDERTTDSEIYEYAYGEPNGMTSYFPGAYTKFGEVSPLLSDTDDKFAIMGGGDEAAVRFAQPLPPAPGFTRRYIAFTNGYYKDLKSDTALTVDPLPFAAMSNYPYPPTEQYPTDADHQDYLREWNTREETLVSSADFGTIQTAEAALTPDLLASADTAPVESSAFQTAAARIVESIARPALIVSPPKHRSLNTDLIMLEASYVDSVAGSCGMCHGPHGTQAPEGGVYPSLQTALETQSCTGNGTSSCHGGPNSTSGINVAASITATSNPTAHHDLTAEQSAASGSRLTCSDCHNAHTDDAAFPFKNPASIGTTIGGGTADYIDSNGDYYALVGAQHDGVPPLISGFSIDTASRPATSPAFAWTTDEPATTRLDIGLTTAYELGSLGSDAPLTKTHSVVASDLAVGQVYHYRVRSADALGNTSVSNDATYSPVAPPAAPVPVPVLGGVDITDVTMSWSGVVSPDGHPVEYQAVLTDGYSTYNYGWSPTPSWQVFGLGFGSWQWRVRARDAVDTFSVGAWSSWSSFQTWSSTCPYLFTWDGTKYGFEIDLYGQGKLAIPRAGGFFKPEPHEAYVLRNEPALKDGYLDFRMVEERTEVNYLDEWSLYAVDVPDGLDVYTERPVQGSAPFGGIETVIHTARSDAPAPSAAVWVNTGQDVLDTISRSDEDRLTLNADRNVGFDYQTIELDLSDAYGAPQTKLLIDAQTMFPDSPEGSSHAASYTYRTRIEVQDGNGAWVAVPAATAVLPPPAEFRRPIALDITDIWQSSSRKVRLTFLYKTYIDSIRVDTTLDAAVAPTKLSLNAATLQQHGQDFVTGPGEFYEFIYGEPNDWKSHFPGNYTRFGDVASLLGTGGDDKYVVFGGGDEIAARFEPPSAAPPAGTSRKYVVLVDGWYKDVKSDVAKTVDPLPFHAMSNYPYPAEESYPTDAEHQQYLSEYNTRYEDGLVTSGAAGASLGQDLIQQLSSLISMILPDDATSSTRVADSRSDYTLTFQQGAQEPVRGPYSVDTDQVVLRLFTPTGAVQNVAALAGWESSGATPTPAAPGTAVGSAALDQAASVDQAYWRSDLTSIDRAWNFQVVKFHLTDEQIGTGREIALWWTGHGEPSVGYPAFVSIWNVRTGQWDRALSPTDAPSDVTAGRSTMQVGSVFCLTCHSGTPPAGVVVPPGVVNVGADWTGLSGGEWHSGVPSAGNGGGLKAPYSRGQAVTCSACHMNHGGTNLYHIPDNVNGSTGVVVTNSNSAQSLCAACHSGSVHDWHQACSDCHVGTTGRFGHGGDSMTPSASSDCLACHGHDKPWQHWASDPANFDSAGCHCGVPAYPKTF